MQALSPWLCYRSQMVSGVIRFLLLSLLAPAVVANNECGNPSVQCEWRKFSTSERAKWIKAANVLTYDSLTI